MSKEPKKQFSLTLLMRVLLGVLVVVSIGIFANSVMRYNALLEEQRELEHKLASYEEMKEELQELLNSDYDYEYIVKIAKEQLGLYFPDEEIFIMGGAEIYNQFMPYIDKIYLTKIYKSNKEADTFIDIPFDDFRMVYKSELKRSSGLGYKFINYIRK